jgi:TRAP-type transport system periplasmic protein
MSFIRTASAAVTGLATLAALTGCTAGAGTDDDTITLRYAFFAPAESFPGVQMEEWKKELEERTDGKVEVELYPGGTLLGAGDIYDGVSSGVVDVGLDSPAYDTSRFAFSSVINNPVGAEDSQSASKAFLDLLLEYEPAEFADYEIVTAFTTEPAYFQTQDPVSSVADVSGAELHSSAAVGPILERMDAAPVGLPMPEVAESLQTGVISGYVSSREVMEDFGLAEQVSYVTDYPLGVSNSFVAVMDQEKFDQLPEDVQDAIVELRPEMTEFASSYHDDENVSSALEFAADAGVETVEVDRADRKNWDRIMTESTEAWVADHQNADFDPTEVLDRLRSLIAEHEGAAE